jgi:hypothetical protein
MTRSRRPLPVPAALGPAVAAVLALAACAGDDASPASPSTRPSNLVPPVSSASAAATVPPGAATAVPQQGAKVAAADLARRVGAAAAAERTVAFEVVATGAQDISGKGVADGSGGASRIRIDAFISGSPLGIVKTGPTIYFKPPAPISGKPWLKVSTNAVDPVSKIYSQAFLGLDSAADVPRIATFMKDMGQLTEAAKEPVDGVPTTKYVGSPPPATAIRLVPGPYQGLGGSPSLKGAKAVVSLWVDDEGLLRRTAVVFTLRDVPPVQSLVSYKNWGQPVTVQAPPAGEVLTPPAASP